MQSHNNKCIKLVFVAALMIMLCSFVSAISRTTCTNINVSGYYTLDAPINTSSSIGCINISTNDVTFDCQGYQMYGVNYTSTNGIWIKNGTVASGYVTNITIKNCKISYWDNGIYAIRANNINITNTSSTWNTNGSSATGIELSWSNNVYITNNSADNNEEGISVSAGTTYYIYNNTAADNQLIDMSISGTDASYCDGYYVKNNTGSAGRRIGFYNRSVTISNEVFAHLSLCNADFSNLTNITINGSLLWNNNYLQLRFTENATISNSTFWNNRYGVNSQSGGNNTYRNNFWFGDYDEIKLYDDDNIIEYNNISGIDTCIAITGNNMIVRGNYGWNSSTCVENDGSHVSFYNNVWNCSTGIRLEDGHNNIINNDTFFGSGLYGLRIFGDSYNNTVMNSIIQGRNFRMGGIRIEAPAQNTSIFNNFLNNTVNINFETTKTLNYFNTTRQFGTRIFSDGSYIGGNYYTNSSSNGYSDTCADVNKTGICDLPYNITTNTSCSGATCFANATDYLPLSSKFLYVAPTSYTNFTIGFGYPNPINLNGANGTTIWGFLVLPRWAYIYNATLTVNRYAPLYCNQENANQSSNCGGLSTGVYAIVGTFQPLVSGLENATINDNNWSSYSISDTDTVPAYVMINYTYPSFFQLNESKWMAKLDSSLYNSVFPLGCQKNPIELNITSLQLHYTRAYCKDDTGAWNLLISTTFGSIYEEAMNWSYPVQNSTFTVSNNWTTIKRNVTANGYTFSANESLLNEILDANCTCSGCIANDSACSIPVAFYADTQQNISIYIENYSYQTTNYLNIFAFNVTGGRYYNISIQYNGSWYNDTGIYRGNYNRSPQNFTVKVIDYLGYYRSVNISVNISKEFYSRNVTLQPYSIDNCSTYTYHILDGRFYIEDYPLVNTTVSYEISAGNAGMYNFSITGEKYNFSICIDGDYTVHFGEMYIKYILGDVTHKYYYYDEDFNPNSIHNLNLFILNTTTGVSELDGVVRNTHTYDYLPDVYVSLHRYYASDNTWRVVQMDKSDAFGQLYFNIRENIYDYYLTFEHLGTEIYDTGTLKFVCSGGVCVLTFTVSPYEETMAMVNMHPTYNYNKNTGIITITWDDTSMTVDNVTVDVTLLAPTSTTICYMNSNNYTGQFSCNVTGYHGTIFVTAREYGSRSAIIAEYIILPLKLLGGFLSDQGLTEDATFWAGGIIATVSIAGALISPILAIVFAIFGLMIVSYLGISSMITMAFVIPACIVGIIISLLMRNG